MISVTLTVACSMMQKILKNSWFIDKRPRSHYKPFCSIQIFFFFAQMGFKSHDRYILGKICSNWQVLRQLNLLTTRRRTEARQLF